MIFKAITFLTLSSFAIGLSHPPAGRDYPTEQNQTAMKKETTGAVQLRTLAEGSHSSITESFVAVIRDAETYAKLVEAEPNLPKLQADFFSSNVVVAAFLGTRNTGGYRAAISSDANGKIRVVEVAPSKGGMVTQVITSPFKVVSFPSAGGASVELSVGETLRSASELYRVSKGSFDVSGGFTGRTESFQLSGKIQITRFGNLVTIGFALVTSGHARERSLRDTATGVIRDGQIVITRLGKGSLLDPPSGDLVVSGKFPAKNKLTLELSSKPINIPENYSGRGTIEADLVAASAN